MYTFKSTNAWVDCMVQIRVQPSCRTFSCGTLSLSVGSALLHCFLREENPEDPDVVRKTAFGQRYTWYIPDYQFRKRNGQQVRRHMHGSLILAPAVTWLVSV